MKHKNNYASNLLLSKTVITLITIGLGIVLFATLNPSSTSSLSTIAFAVSVVALILTTLQSISIGKQLQVTQESARLVAEAGRQIELLVKEDKKIELEIRQDMKMDQKIIAVLEEYGVGTNENERALVAERISGTVQQHARTAV